MTTDKLIVGTDAYRAILYRVNHLERKKAIGRGLPFGEQRELERERAKLEAAELERDKAQTGAHT